MRKTLGQALVGVGALTASPAFAQDDDALSGNLALTTDYVFRGISQTRGAPAVQGGADYDGGFLYAGAWASNVDFDEFDAGSGVEVDLYAGLRPEVGPVIFDVGVVGYFYPGVKDLQAGGDVEGELDYVEAYAKASVSPLERLTLGAALYFSPEFAGETGAAYYGEASAEYALTDATTVSASVGYQTVEDVSGVFPGDFSDAYTTWSVGLTQSFGTFELDVRYTDTDIEASDDLIIQAFTTEARAEARVAATISWSF